MGDIISTLTGSNKKARRAQTHAAEDANNDLGKARDLSLGRLQPYVDAGSAGLGELAMRLGLSGDETNPLYGSLTKTFTGADLPNTPGYQFGLEQGSRALNNSAGARGNLLSGSALKAAERFGQDYAGTQFQAAYDRDNTDKNRIANFLGNVATIGQNATNSANDTQMNASLQYGANTIGAGNALAAQHIAQGQGWNSIVNTGLSAAAMAAMGGFGGLPGMGAGAATTGGAASTGAMTGFSQNLLNPNFAKNYVGLG